MSNIRNIGIVAHVDAGKTTTTEHILYQSGHIRTIGRVDDGTAFTDWLDVERSRGISVKAAVTRFTWKSHTFNLIDTPGHVDFAAEVDRALAVLDGAILVISAIEGVQAHTETLWRSLRALHIPTIVFLNKMDRIGIDLGRTLNEVRALLGATVVPIQTHSGVGESFEAVHDIFSAQSLDTTEAVDTVYAALAETDDEWMASYVEGKKPDVIALKRTLQAEAKKGNFFPLLYGASLRGTGIPELLDATLDFLPDAESNHLAPLSGRVFKIERDKSQGKVAYVRLFSGALKNRDIILNHTQQVEEKVNQIRQVDGSRRDDTGELKAGDVAALYGLHHTKIGDLLGEPSPFNREIGQMTTPLLTVQVTPTQPDDYMRLVDALRELDSEDPALSLLFIPEDHALHIRVLGTIQLEIIKQIMLDRFHIRTEFSQPSVIYKETPHQSGFGFVAYTMPKPCWAILRFSIDPGEPGTGLTYAANVRTEDLLQAYQNEVEKRVPEALQQGLYGWEVTDLRVTLIEGQHHVWHTHPLDFVIATPMAIMDGLNNTGTDLLEPILSFRVSSPDEYSGRILNDLATLRAQFDNPVIRHGRFEVEGIIPLATSMDYAVHLGMLTGGRGVFSTRFLTYEKCPPDVRAERTRRGVNPLDTSKYILWARSALTTSP